MFRIHTSKLFVCFETYITSFKKNLCIKHFSTHLLKEFISLESWPFYFAALSWVSTRITIYLRVKSFSFFPSIFYDSMTIFLKLFFLFLVTQITMQQTMRTLAFACESCVFAYLGLAIFSFPHKLELSLIIWSILFILIGRALNICKWSLFKNKILCLLKCPSIHLA